MSVDIDNIKGVFTDLDDGGLDEGEALAQIRELVGVPAKTPMPKRVLYTMLVPVTLTINLEEESVESAEIETGNVWGPLPNQLIQDADTHQDLDQTDDTTSDVEEKARAVADEDGWLYEMQIV